MRLWPSSTATRRHGRGDLGPMSAARLDFLVRYAESEGALVDAVPEGAVIVLPDELQRRLELDDVIMVTEDPEVARDEGFLLLPSGHPLLSSAAQAVLEQGDVGCAHLPRPPGPPPSPTLLEARAREQLHADHGRIDAAGAPHAIYLAALQVGALVTFSVSIDERVQEVEDVWVESASGEALPDELRRRLVSAGTDPALPPGAALPNGIEKGVAGAHRALVAHAEQRAAELARQTSARLRRQLEVVDDYYQRVIDSIAERQARAQGDRARMLSAQAEATEAEWKRRRAEVTDDLTPSFDLLPFRLRLLLVPSYELPVVIRRGQKAYPLSLTYVPLTASFLAPRCPSCGSPASLVAAKDRLGCTACVSAGSTVSEAPTESGTEATPVDSHRVPHGSAARPATSAEDPRRHAQVPPDAVARPADNHAPRSRQPGASSGRVTPKGTRRAGDLSRTGSRLAMEFWGCVLGGERWRSRDTVASSPLAALLRLYGSHGPALVVALHDDEQPMAISSSTDATDLAGWATTLGELRTSAGREVPFALRWSSDKGAAIAEVETFPLGVLGPLLVRGDGIGKAFRHRYSERLRPPPTPMVALPQAPAALLLRATRRAGLAYAARCMAAWWYVTDAVDGAAASTGDRGESLARVAALETVVAKRAGMRVTTTAAADSYDCAVEDVRAETRRLQSVIRDCPDTGW